jgi:hypothetical protein
LAQLSAAWNQATPAGVAGALRNLTDSRCGSVAQWSKFGRKFGSILGWFCLGFVLRGNAMRHQLQVLGMLGCLVLSLPLTALAQDEGTEAERQACEPDVNRLCSQFIPDRDKIIVCLNQKIRELSPACRTVMLYYAQARICQKDGDRLCGDYADDREQMFSCMRQKIRLVSASCRNAFNVYAREKR